MKKYSIITGSLLILMFLAGGCKKYLDINENPNAANTPPIAGLLANTTYLTANNVFSIGDWVSYYSQYFASPSAGSATDTYDQTNPTGSWGGIYNVLTDVYDMRKLAQEKGSSAYEGASDILTAMNLSMAINIWGDVPYSEAFIGVSNLAPKFDNQKDLYDTCLALIDQGISFLQQSGTGIALDKKSDFIHGGDQDAWIKTAYSLKARLLNQVSKTPQYDATAVLAAVDNAYTSNADDAQVNQFSVRNPFADEAIDNANLNLDVWLSKNFVDATNGVTYGLFDPRLPLITDANDSGYYAGVDYPAGGYRGTPNGAGYQGKRNTDNVQNYLSVDKWYSSTNSPLQIITNSEIRFVEAEAAFRSGDKVRAYTAYIAGITASMEKLGVATDKMNAYINDPIVSVGEGNLTLQLIMKEKYVACFLMPVTWVDLRRFDYNYKDFTLPVNSTLTTFIRRGDYPTTATTRNGANVPAWERTDHLWWDK